MPGASRLKQRTGKGSLVWLLESNPDVLGVIKYDWDGTVVLVTVLFSTSDLVARYRADDPGRPSLQETCNLLEATFSKEPWWAGVSVNGRSIVVRVHLEYYSKDSIPTVQALIPGWVEYPVLVRAWQAPAPPKPSNKSDARFQKKKFAAVKAALEELHQRYAPMLEDTGHTHVEKVQVRSLPCTHPRFATPLPLMAPT